MKNQSIVSRNLELFLMGQKLTRGTDDIVPLFISSVQGADNATEVLDDLDDDLIDEYNDMVKSLNYSISQIRKLLEERVQAISQPSKEDLNKVKQALLETEPANICGEASIRKHFMKVHSFSAAQCTALSLIMFEVFRDFRKFQYDEYFLEKIRGLVANDHDSNTEKSAVMFVNYDNEHSRVDNGSKMSRFSRTKTPLKAKTVNDSLGIDSQLPEARNTPQYKGLNIEVDENFAGDTQRSVRSRVSKPSVKHMNTPRSLKVNTGSKAGSCREPKVFSPKRISNKKERRLVEATQKSGKSVKQKQSKQSKTPIQPYLNTDFEHREDKAATNHQDYSIGEEIGKSLKDEGATIAIGGKQGNTSARKDKAVFDNTEIETNEKNLDTNKPNPVLTKEPTDEELCNVAIKIQSVFKAKKDRQKFAELKKAKEAKKREEAAVKIQKIHRGRRDRQRVKRLRALRQEEEKAAREIEEAYKRKMSNKTSDKAQKKINISALVHGNRNTSKSYSSKYDDSLAEETIQHTEDVKLDSRTIHDDQLGKSGFSRFNESKKISKFDKQSDDSRGGTSNSHSKAINYEHLIDDSMTQKQSVHSGKDQSENTVHIPSIKRSKSATSKIESKHNESKSKMDTSSEELENQNCLDTEFNGRSTSKDEMPANLNKTTYALTDAQRIEPKTSQGTTENKVQAEVEGKSPVNKDNPTVAKKSMFYEHSVKTSGSVKEKNKTPLGSGKKLNEHAKRSEMKYKTPGKKTNAERVIQSCDTAKGRYDVKQASHSLVKSIYKSAMKDVNGQKSPKPNKDNSIKESKKESFTSSFSDKLPESKKNSSIKKSIHARESRKNSRVFSNAEVLSQKDTVLEFDTSSFNDDT